MKKLLLVLAFPLLLVSCGKANQQEEVTFAGMCAAIKVASATKKPTKAVGKYSGTANGNKVNSTITFTPDGAGGISQDKPLPTAVGTQKPGQLTFAVLAAAGQDTFEQQVPGSTDTVTWFLFSKYYVNPFRLVTEAVYANSPSANVQNLFYQKWDYTFNSEQWVTKLHYEARVNRFADGSETSYVWDLLNTFTYTF